MYILVDYDNLSEQHSRKGIRFLVDSLMNELPRAWPHPEREIRCRLYSGWYEESHFTPLAQTVTTELMQDFPRLLRDKQATVRLYADLAISLLTDPSRQIGFTYRRKNPPSNLRCNTIESTACPFPASCPLAPLPKFVKKRKCYQPGCTVRSTDLLYRAEQKLVDSMLISDLLYLAFAKHEIVGIVGSDHDLWPGIRTALGIGARIIHCHSKSGQLLPEHYCSGMPSTYLQVEI